MTKDQVIILGTHRIYSDTGHRFRISQDQNAVQTLPAGGGEGGGTLPYVLVIKDKEKSDADSR